MKTKSTTETTPETTLGKGTVQPRHIVENEDFVVTKNGFSHGPFNPSQKTLCGKPWDRFNPKHNGVICEECVQELRRRGQG